MLARAPAGVIESDEPNPGGGLVARPIATNVPVANGSSRARVWDYSTPYGRTVTVRWTGPDGFDYELESGTPPAGSLGVAQTEALTRSVH